MLKTLLDVLFPKKCVGCNKVGSYFCSNCIANIFPADLICPVCSRASLGGQTHPVCREKLGLDGLWSMGIYKNPLKTAIGQLKYRNVRELGKNLVDILVENWEKFKPQISKEIIKDKRVGWAVVPVPLYWFRENSRGFNQSAIIGQSLSKKLGLAYCEGLKRTRSTKSQVSLKSQDRRQNLQNAFAVNSQFSIVNSQLLLIDDVWTTGSTIKECCKVLKEAGAKKVWAITLAR